MTYEIVVAACLCIRVIPKQNRHPDGHLFSPWAPLPKRISHACRGDTRLMAPADTQPSIRWSPVTNSSAPAAAAVPVSADAPASIKDASGNTYTQSGGTWLPRDLSIRGALTAAPTGSTVAGLYTMAAGVPPSGVALGDIFYWTGAAATPWLSFSAAPPSISIGGAAYFKQGAVYVAPSTSSTSSASSPAFGQVIIPGQNLSPASASWADVNGASVDIPSAGTWLLAYNVRVSSGGAQSWGVALFDSQNNQVAGSQAGIFVASGDPFCLGATVLVTTNGPLTYRLRMMTSGGINLYIAKNFPATPIYSQSQSNLLYVKIA